MEVSCLTSTARPPPSNKKEGNHVVRPLADFHPTVWGDFFNNSVASQDPVLNDWKQHRVEELKEALRVMFGKRTGDHGFLKGQMELVDTLQRLGLARHFQEEIREALAGVYQQNGHMLVNCDDLHAVALLFRLLRQEGYNVPSDIFNRFKDLHGHFQSSLAADVNGLLSLYEAAYLATPTERLLYDEAVVFSKRDLEDMLDHLQPHLAAEVARALETPLNRRICRFEHRQYIAFYEAKEGHNDLILELAKLDFNIVQALHQNEIGKLTVWWKQLGLIQKLNFARDRLVESFFWALGVYWEPQFSRCRIMLAKVIALTSVVDDIYDAYGTLEELHMFTAAIRRWDLDPTEEIPEYMKICFAALSDTFKDIENELMDEENSYRVEYLKEQMKLVVLAYFEEAKWCHEGYIPNLEEHLQVSLTSSGYQMVICASFLGMGDIATEEAFNWVKSYPKIVKASTIIARLMDDIQSYEFEQKRQHVASTVQCCMKEYCASKEEACKKLNSMIEDAWRDLNQEYLQPSTIPMQLLMSSLNASRLIEVYYKYSDGFTHPSEGTKALITQLLVDGICA